MAEIVSDPVRTRQARAAWPLVHVVVASGLSPVDVDPWQAWLETRFPQATWVRPLDGDWPDVDRWAGRIDEALAAGGPVAPSLLLAHGFGALAAVRHAEVGRHDVSAAMLVTPAQPRRFALESGRLMNRLACPATLLAPLGGAHDESPWLQDDDAVDWATVGVARWSTRDAARVGTGMPYPARRHPGPRPRRCSAPTWRRCWPAHALHNEACIASLAGARADPRMGPS